jgi:hypothetical protein
MIPLLQLIIPMQSPLASALVVVCGLPIVSVVFISVVAMTQHHRRKMAELRIKEHRLLSDDVRAELDGIKEEIRSLRDVTTQYDLSFDTTLQQVERRVSQLEHEKYTGADTTQQTQYAGGNNGRQY